MLFWLTMGGVFGLLFLIGALAQYQRQRHQRFYAQEADATNGAPTEPSAVGFPLHHP
jgi:hypothetical protein